MILTYLLEWRGKFGQRRTVGNGRGISCNADQHVTGDFHAFFHLFLGLPAFFGNVCSSPFAVILSLIHI